MIRPLLMMGDPALRKVSERVHLLGDRLTIQENIQDLRDTMKKGDFWINRVGGHAAALAAPQIGIHRRIVLLNLPRHKDVIMINPAIISSGGRMKHDEMCLSYPQMKKRTTRRQYVKVEYWDEHLNPKTETFCAMDAFVVQHELDHLDGKLLDDQ